MRILHLSDTHLGHTLAARGAPRGWSRHQDHLHAMLRALEPAHRGEVDLVVHTGDVFNRSRPPRAVAEAAARVLRGVAARVPVVVLAGNHDRNGVGRSLGWGAVGLHVVDGPARLVFGEVALACVPFVRQANDWAAAARLAAGPGADLLLAHQAFHGAAVPGLTFTVGRQPDTVGAEHLPAGIRHVLCGHIHPRQALSLGDACVVHAGSTERTAWSEAGQTKGTVIWKLDGGVRWRFADLPGRPLVWVGRSADLGRVTPGALVRVARDAAECEDLEQAVRARGGWLAGVPAGVPRTPAPPSRQVGLFDQDLSALR